MGMSAGQARLLSITARLTDNELRSQTITNSKLRLADKSTEASQEYMDALNSTQLMYGIYGSDGKLTYESLTANTILAYGDLKNQYSLVNSSGQIMLNGTDIKKYEDADSLTEFLLSYGISEIDNPSYSQALIDIYGNRSADDGNYLYEKLYDENDPYIWSDYFSALTDTDIAGLKNLTAKDPTQVTPDDAKIISSTVADWETKINSNDLLKLCPDLTGSFSAYINELLTPPNVSFPDRNDFLSEEGTELAHKFTISSEACYDNAVDGNGQRCYIHVLAHLLDLKTEDVNAAGDVDSSWGREYSSTLGNKYTINTNRSGGINDSSINSHNRTAYMAEVSEVVCADNDNDGVEDLLAPAEGAEITEDTADVDKLLSNYKLTADGDLVQKTFKEKVIDLYYVVEHFTDEDMKKSDGKNYTYDDLKVYLQEFDKGMKEVLNTVTPEYYEAIQDWQNTIAGWLQNIADLKTAYIDDLNNLPGKTVADDNDARYQWYVNLYYRMGGGAENADGTKNTNNYKAIDDNLLNSAEWLQFALEQGILTMEQAVYSENGSQEYPEIGDYDWQSIIYTSASDIKSQENETAIAIAEVKYQNAMADIQNQDKKYDQDLKKLDTEHNALQTEYESVKSVIEKNVERSFKAFS